MAGRGRGGTGGLPHRRQVLEDAEAHGGHRLPGVVERLHLVVRHRPHRHVGVGDRHVVEPGGDEAPGAQPGPLGVRDRLNDRAHQQPVADHQGTVVVLLAVGGDDRGQALVIEQVHHLLVGPAPLAAALGPGLLGEQRGAQAPHDPGLQHGGRGDELVVPRGARRLVGHVHRVVIAHGLDPVPDHRHVHRVGRQARRTGHLPDQRGQLGTVVRERRQLLEPLASPRAAAPDAAGGRHRAPRVIPSPAVATISRCTSFTPPPNVLICAWRPVASTRPRSTAPGEPGTR